MSADHRRDHPLVLGSAQWGLRYGIANSDGLPSLEVIQGIAQAAAAAGVRTIDTARAYGHAEAVIGALDGGWRVITKLAPDVSGDDVDPDDSRMRAARSLEVSRAALGRDRLDGVLLHRTEHRYVSGGAAWTVLLEQRHAGRIGSIGCSVVNVADAMALLDDPECEILQVPASLLDRRLARVGFFESARDLGREIFVRSVFLQGVAHMQADTLPEHLDPLRDVLAALDDASRTEGVARWELFLAWARHRTAGARVIVGCETEEQARENLAAWVRPSVEAVLNSVEDRIPELPDAILDPWRWPAPTSAESDQKASR